MRKVFYLGIVFGAFNIVLYLLVALILMILNNPYDSVPFWLQTWVGITIVELFVCVFGAIFFMIKDNWHEIKKYYYEEIEGKQNREKDNN